MADSSPNPDEQVAAAVERGVRWDALAAIIAALVGLLALCVSGYTAYIQREQVRAQVWPYLLAGNDDGDQSIYVYNKGVGPAIVKTAQIFIDGKAQTDWVHVLTALGLPSQRILSIHAQSRCAHPRRTGAHHQDPGQGSMAVVPRRRRRTHDDGHLFLFDAGRMLDVQRPASGRLQGDRATGASDRALPDFAGRRSIQQLTRFHP